MDLSSLQRFVNVPNSVPGAYVVAGRPCPVCQLPIAGEEWVMALPAPYHCLVHKDCSPFFSYNGVWPHPLPAAAYVKAARRRSSPPLIESGEM